MNSLPYVIRFLGGLPLARIPFATEAERASYLKSWGEVRGDLALPAPVEGQDYELINYEGN